MGSAPVGAPGPAGPRGKRLTGRSLRVSRWSGQHAGPQRINDGDGKAIGTQRAMGVAMELARRLHHDAYRPQPNQKPLQLTDAAFVIADPPALALGMDKDIDIEPVFTRPRRRKLKMPRLVWVKPCLAYGTCSPSSVQDKREDGRTKLTYGSSQGACGPDRKIPWGLHPSRDHA